MLAPVIRRISLQDKQINENSPLYFANELLRLNSEFLVFQEFCHAKITSSGPDGGGGGTEVKTGGQDFSWIRPILFVKVPLLAIILLHELRLSSPTFYKKRLFPEAFF